MMPDSFRPVNVTDTCAVWNLVGAATLFRTALRQRLSFAITNTVFYECFIKSRGKRPSAGLTRLRGRLRQHLQRGQVVQVDATIEDLQEVMAMARRRGLVTRLGYGEVSCIAAARRLRQAVLTDNKRDFRAIEELIDGVLQTTPRLLGWLYLEEQLTDGDIEAIIVEHTHSGGQMTRVYKQAYREACQRLLMR